MRSDIKIRFGKTRGTPEHYFRVQVSLDGGQSFRDALVMKKDDKDGPDRYSTPFKVAWAATKGLEQEAEAALSRLETRFSAKHTKAELQKFLKGVTHHYVPPDAEIPVEVSVRIANSRVERGRDAGKELSAWEREADAAALRRAGIADQAGNEGSVRRTGLFDWVPWFRELAEAVGKVRQEGLVAAANNIDWAGGKVSVLSRGEETADPLTFFYHLAAIAKSKRRKTVYASVAEAFGIESDLDYSLDSGFIFPTPDPRFVMFKNSEGPSLFWEMFDWARGQDGTSYGADLADTFTRTLQIKGVGVPKLTQVLFLINPRAFLPFDAAAVMPLGIGTLKKHPANMSWDEYVHEMGNIRAAFPGCHGYEINVIGYLWTSKRFPREGNRWFQVGTTEDGWRGFRDNHWVHHGGQGDKQQLDEPKPGDVVLVRSGTQEGRGIGIVYRNDYRDQSHRNGRIHVLWVNKEHAALAANLPTVGFSEADLTAYEAFAKSAAYSPTLGLLQPPRRPPGKNTNTLYAEFYQPLVARLGQKGVQPVGEGGWRGRWRSFQTGYTGAVYGMGLDDGRAKVFLAFRGAGNVNERRFRALLQHREEIDGTVRGTVSWLDASHGDWGTTVLLEGDVAFSLTGPDEELEATRLWMADTLLALRAAVQPHLAQVMRVGPRSLASLIQSLKHRRLRFPRETVANYILALQTKRFAILTGISGTGKTKIAKAVALHFEHSQQGRVATIPDDADGIKAVPSMFKYSMMIIRVAMVDNLNLLGPDAPLAERKILVRYPVGQAKLTYSRNHLGATSLIFRGDFKKWFQSTFKVGNQFWVRVRPSEMDDPGELEFGLPETRFVDKPLGNYTVIPVRPDWVDNRGLLGYLNPLTNEYSTTEFLDLLLRARDEERRAEAAGEKPHPFFVILDEMNLARVEHYFSDFLSALESGESIPLHENETIESGESESGPQVPRKLKVPGNVLFTGTVNVDETTYMFSPKVLDRAFTIEFDQVDLKGFAEDASSDDASGLNLDAQQESLDLLQSGSSDDDDWKPSRDDWVEFSEQTAGHHAALLRLHDILEAQHRHFGYRVANEIARFVNLARQQSKDSNAGVDAAFDLALLQKVLPKFHGTQQELGSLLEEIFHFAVHGGGQVAKNNQTVDLAGWKVDKGRLVSRLKAEASAQASASDAGAEGDEPKSDDGEAPGSEAPDTGTQSPVYPRTGAKVLRMLRRLRDRGFTSFIE